MSYEYDRVKLKPGLNLINGPNGSGKSSILLAISVALGQAYTERSRKLSDLIRRGKDIARVSLLFDNKPREGRRPISFSKSDTFLLSRYLKKDGSYWFEADYREISKNEVTDLFERFGTNPDNLLIIMHQGMVEEFAITSPQEKLKMLEEAVGFQEYREKMTDSQIKLESVISEEDALTNILEGASQAVDYWKEVYTKYLEKKSLLEKKAGLERELTWANALKLEKSRQSLVERKEAKTRALDKVSKKLSEVRNAAEEAFFNLQAKQGEVRKLYYMLVKVEKDKAAADARVEESERVLQASVGLGEHVGKESDTVRALRGLFKLLSDAPAYVDDLKRRSRLLEVEGEATQGEIVKGESQAAKLLERFVELKVSEAHLDVERRSLERDIEDVQRGIREVEESLRLIQSELERAAPRVETERNPSEVNDDLKVVLGHLQALEDVPDDAEQIYANYASGYDDVKRKLAEVEENRKKVLEELRDRKKVWQEALGKLVEEISPVYQEILSSIGAAGFVRLVDSENVDSAGLELVVGFKGNQPVILDAYSQSGGERSVAVVAFLLALQRRVVSSFRALDEFDLHMDPLNRELISKMIFSQAASSKDTQHIVITPSQISVVNEDANYLFVQNVRGRSQAMEVSVR